MRKWFLGLTLRTKWIPPCDRAWKTVPQNGVVSCVHFCLRLLRLLKDVISCDEVMETILQTTIRNYEKRLREILNLTHQITSNKFQKSLQNRAVTRLKNWPFNNGKVSFYPQFIALEQHCPFVKWYHFRFRQMDLFLPLLRFFPRAGQSALELPSNFYLTMSC